MWGFIPHVRGGYKPVGQLYEKLVGLNLLITNTHIPVFWNSANACNFCSLNSSYLTIRKRIRDARVCGQKNIAQVFIPFHQQTIQTIG